jgi:hypothetical protein
VCASTALLVSAPAACLVPHSQAVWFSSVSDSPMLLQQPAWLRCLLNTPSAAHHDPSFARLLPSSVSCSRKQVFQVRSGCLHCGLRCFALSVGCVVLRAGRLLSAFSFCCWCSLALPPSWSQFAAFETSRGFSGARVHVAGVL